MPEKSASARSSDIDRRHRNAKRQPTSGALATDRTGRFTEEIDNVERLPLASNPQVDDQRVRGFTVSPKGCTPGGVSGISGISGSRF